MRTALSSTGEAQEAGEALAPGQRVHVYYRGSLATLQPGGRRATSTAVIAVPKDRGGSAAASVSPRMGLTTGWLEAVVVAVALAGGGAQVNFTNHAFYDRLSCRVDGSLQLVPREDVAPWSTSARPVPRVGVIGIRWGAHADVATPWLPAEAYLGAGGAFARVYGRDFEAWTAFVTRGAHLEALASSAHLLLAHHPVRRCTHVGAMFFLTPTRHDEGSTVYQATGGGHGSVSEGPLFAAMRRIEAAGVPVRFPHPPSLYRLLLSKEWVPHLATEPSWGLPVTVALPVGAVWADGEAAAARRALAQLEAAKAARGEEPTSVARGVAKLGYSWEANDVVSWSGAQELAGALTTLLSDVLILDVAGAVGQTHAADQVLVQEFFPNAFEVRCYLINGVLELAK